MIKAHTLAMSIFLVSLLVGLINEAFIYSSKPLEWFCLGSGLASFCIVWLIEKEEKKRKIPKVKLIIKKSDYKRGSKR